jgi:hypothetical protein
VEATVKVAVDVPEPGAAIELGLKPTVTPVGAPEAVRAIAELNPPEMVVVTVEFPLLPAATEIDDGAADIVNAGVWVPEPVSAVIRPLFGLPHPVTRS